MDHGTQATFADPINNAFSAASYQPAYDGQSQWNHVFGPNATNQFIIAGSYYRAIFTQNDPALFPYSVITGFNLTQLGGTVFNFPQGRNTTQYQIVDDYSLTKGAHNMKFGVNYRRYDITDYAFSVLNNPAGGHLRPASTSMTGSHCSTGNAFRRAPRNRSRYGAWACMRRMSGGSARA